MRAHRVDPLRLPLVPPEAALRLPGLPEPGPVVLPFQQAFAQLAQALDPEGVGASGVDTSWHPLVRERLRAPHAEQVRFITSPAKRKVIRGGRRGGKTVGVAHLALTAFLAGRRVL